MASKLKTAQVVLRQYKASDFQGYWATVRLSERHEKEPFVFCYDTEVFPTRDKAYKEAKAFCRWKKLKIMKVWDKGD